MLKCTNKIAILMATYNGGRFLAEQIDSIINQTEVNWNLYIRDDGSSDNTIDIIRQYELKDSRIVLLEDNEVHLGSKNSFMKALVCVEAELYMFADQDDYWLPNKIEISLKAYNAVPFHEAKPVIVHTNISIADANLNVIKESRWDDINLDPNRLKIYEFLAICCYTQGCTMLFNNRVKELALPIADYASMHDWWISTRCIKAGGVIETIYSPTMLYRQHDNNVVGMPNNKDKSLSFRIKERISAIRYNYERYLRLKRDGYGSIYKYIYFKFMLFLHMSKKNI